MNYVSGNIFRKTNFQKRTNLKDVMNYKKFTKREKQHESYQQRIFQEKKILFPLKANILTRIYTLTVRTQTVKSAIIYLPMRRGHCKEIEAKLCLHF